MIMGEMVTIRRPFLCMKSAMKAASAPGPGGVSPGPASAGGRQEGARTMEPASGD
jgi:hypothetical protein